MSGKVLILSGPFGEGHKQAAQALLETCRLHKPGVEPVVVDFMEWTLPRLHGVSKAVFHRGVQTFPSVYGYLFRHTRKSSPLTALPTKLRWYGLKRIVRLIEEVEPSVVVCTFPLAAYAMSALKMAGMTDVPAVTVITDHTDHSYWLHPGTDLYLVGSEKVRQGLKASGVPDSRIRVTGIPVRPHFSPRPDASLRMSLRRKLGFEPDKPLLLLMGGGYGMMQEGMIRLLLRLACSSEVQLAVICGHNDKLRRKLKERLEETRATGTVRVVGFVHNMADFMGAADLVVTKPGGLTTSEAIAMRLPMVLYKPLPGQEEDNAEFLTASRIAVSALDERELHQHVERLLARPAALASMRARMERLHMEQSSAKALEAIFSARHSRVPRWEQSPVRLGV